MIYSSITHNLTHSDGNFSCLCFVAKKRTTKKKEKENIENIGDSKRLDEPAKGFLAKATPTNPNK